MIGRLLFLALVVVPMLIIAIPVQFVIVRFNLPGWQALPRAFHRIACWLMGLRVTLLGEPVAGRPVLLVSNHISWSDILVLGSVADVSFVAKREVGQWPVVSLMASLQKTIYVDRTKRIDAKRTSREMGQRLAAGCAVLLFAEGQSDIGTHVNPFRSALVGGVQMAMHDAGARGVALQPVTIAYTRIQGLPVSRSERNQLIWVKSRSIGQNLRAILGGGVKDVTVAFGAPVSLDPGADRKALTRAAEDQVRATLVALNRGLAPPNP